MSEETIPAAPVAETELETGGATTRSGTSLREYAESLLVTVLLALFGTTFVVQAFKIPSESMKPTLEVGDHLLVNKFIFGGRGHWYDSLLPYRDIRRGDVIVFKYPFPEHAHYVKRVVGLPGDRIKVIEKDVYINGQPLDEPYAFHDPAVSYDPFLYNFPPEGDQGAMAGMVAEWANEISSHVENGELMVPPGQYFAMGDNREHSSDSRFWGFVDREAIMGRPLLIYWSLESLQDDGEDRSGLSAFFYGLSQLPERLRWRRMLRTVH